MSHNLTGAYLVRAGRWAFQEARKWLPRARDRAELRRHALKLRFWPTGDVGDESGTLMDLDWSWVKSLPGTRIGELRIHDTIGGWQPFTPRTEVRGRVAGRDGNGRRR